MVGAVRDPGRFLDWADVVLLVRKNKIGEVLGIVLKAATPKTNHKQPFLDNALFMASFCYSCFGNLWRIITLLKSF